jgi:hypothetical protein
LSDADPTPPPAPAEPSASIEDHQRETNTPAWLHAAALRLERWGLGREITRTDYLAALSRAANHPCGA